MQHNNICFLLLCQFTPKHDYHMSWKSCLLCRLFWESYWEEELDRDCILWQRREQSLLSRLEQTTDWSTSQCPIASTPMSTRFTAWHNSTLLPWIAISHKLTWVLPLLHHCQTLKYPAFNDMLPSPNFVLTCSIYTTNLRLFRILASFSELLYLCSLCPLWPSNDRAVHVL